MIQTHRVRMIIMISMKRMMKRMKLIFSNKNNSIQIMLEIAQTIETNLNNK